MKISIKKISMFVILGCMLNSTERGMSMAKPHMSEPERSMSMPERSMSMPKGAAAQPAAPKPIVSKIITSVQVDQLNKYLKSISENYSNALTVQQAAWDAQVLIAGLPDSK